MFVCICVCVCACLCERCEMVYLKDVYHGAVITQKNGGKRQRTS